MEKAQVSYEDVERKKKKHESQIEYNTKIFDPGGVLNNNMWMNNNNNNNMWMDNNNKINMNLTLDTTQRYSVEEQCSKKVFFNSNLRLDTRQRYSIKEEN